MKKLKMNSRSKSSGQILAVVIIVLALIGGGFWWLFTNKQAMAKEGREFGREAIQRIAVQHDLAFFRRDWVRRLACNFRHRRSRILSPECRSSEHRLVPSTCRETLYSSHSFLNRTATFMPASITRRGAPRSTSPFSHPVGRWQIDDVAFTPDPER